VENILTSVEAPEVGDDAVLHRANGGDITWGTTEHALGFGTDRHHALLVAMGTDGDDRRLVQHDAAFADINQGIGSAQIDRKITGKHATQFFEHGIGTLGNAWVKKCGKL
jgi:hypothetical protein